MSGAVLNCCADAARQSSHAMISWQCNKRLRLDASLFNLMLSGRRAGLRDQVDVEMLTIESSIKRKDFVGFSRCSEMGIE